MQALANYADDSPSPPARSSVAGPSHPREQSPARPRKRWRLPRRTATPSPPRHADSYPPSRSPSHAAGRRSERGSPVLDSRATTSRAPSRAPSEDDFEGMSDDEIFRLATRPPGDESEWGLPPEVDAPPDPRLQAKVSQFLRLKQQGQHINTSLMQSSSFANPTIYAKLVEFVDIDERASAFPGGGWLTRRGLEDQVSAYGPKALQAQQSAMDVAAKRAQEGKRREIAFTSSSRSGRERERDRDRDDRRRDRDRKEKGALHRPRYGWEGGGRRERERR